jgi:hypothetical protein
MREQRAPLVGGQEPEHPGRDDDGAGPGGQRVGGRLRIARDHQLARACGQQAAGPAGAQQRTRRPDQVADRAREQDGRDEAREQAPAGRQLLQRPVGRQ